MLEDKESLQTFFQRLQGFDRPDEATSFLSALTDLTPKIQKALEFAIEAHKDQKRKSGEPYIVHPICTACIVAFYGGDEAMICAALLHDVVEDTSFSLQELQELFGDEVAQIVDALTKIVELRDENIPSGNTDTKILSSALSFRKVLLASVKDVRALFVKISDRLHNMLTLDALSEQKQLKIAEETLVVYAPIAYRLGISSIKNELEDRSFYYLFKEEYQKIQHFLGQHRISLEEKMQSFIQRLKGYLLQEGFAEEDFEIQGRIKRPYSIYLKMQRKGVGIEEILDLLAVRIILKDRIDCYKALGIVHLKLKPIVSKFKDYIALPKENGYQTIHTTIFDETSVFEVQIRTIEMHKCAEYGFAAHWKYKMGNHISLDWLNNIEYKDQNIEEFYELIKSDLYREDIAVFSPMGDVYFLPSGSVALDFAYAVHTELGENANEAYINNQKVSLLERLKSGDIVRIVAGEKTSLKCSWVELVKTSKAKNRIRLNCQNKLRDLNTSIAFCVLQTLFNRPLPQIQNAMDIVGIQPSKMIAKFADFKEGVSHLWDYLKKHNSFFSRLRYLNWHLHAYQFDQLRVLSHKHIDGVIYDYCCYPKQGDEIMGFLENQKVIVHHKFCEKRQITPQSKMVFVDWVVEVCQKYKIIVLLEDTKGSLARFLLDLAKQDCNLTGITYKGYKDQFLTLFEISIETNHKQIKDLKNFLGNKYKIVEFQNLKDAYQ